MFLAVAQRRWTQCRNAIRVSSTVLRPSRTSKHSSCCSRRWNWKHYMKRHRVCEIAAQFVRHTQTHAVCVWSKRWARISAGLRLLLDSSRWRRRRNYHSLMSPIDTAIRRRTIVKYRQPTSTVLWSDCLVLAQLFPVPCICCSLCVCFLNIAPVPVSLTI